MATESRKPCVRPERATLPNSPSAFCSVLGQECCYSTAAHRQRTRGRNDIEKQAMEKGGGHRGRGKLEGEAEEREEAEWKRETGDPLPPKD